MAASSPAVSSCSTSVASLASQKASSMRLPDWDRVPARRISCSVSGVCLVRREKRVRFMEWRVGNAGGGTAAEDRKAQFYQQGPKAFSGLLECFGLVTYRRFHVFATDASGS